MLGDTEKIRTERKLAKKNRNKYIGVGSDGMGSISGSRTSRIGPGSASSRFVGFGSDSFTSSGNGISFNGDAYSFGEETPYPHQSGKYDVDDDDDDSDNQSFSNNNNNSSQDLKKKSVNDDDDWGDFTWGEISSNQQEPKPTTTASLFDDDFDDFQQAPDVEVPKKPQQHLTTQKEDLFDLLGDSTPTSTTQQQPSLDIFESKQPIIPSGYEQQTQQQQSTSAPKLEKEDKTDVLSTGMWAQASNFVSLDYLGKKTAQSTATKGPSMNAMKTNSVQADWSNWANKNSSKPSTPTRTNAQPSSSSFDDLLG